MAESGRSIEFLSVVKSRFPRRVRRDTEVCVLVFQSERVYAVCLLEFFFLISVYN